MSAHAVDYPLPPAEHRSAVHERLRERMAVEGLDALIAISAENFYYLSGSPSSLSYLLPQAGNAAIAVLWPSRPLSVIINDFEASTFPDSVLGCELIGTAHWTGVADERASSAADSSVDPPSTLDAGETYKALGRLIARLPAGARVGIDAVNLPVGAHAGFLASLGGRELVDSTELFYAARSIKTGWEIEQLRTACRISEDAISAAADLIRVGVTERELKVRHDGYIMSTPEGAGIRLSGISVGTTYSIRSFPSTRPGEAGELVRFDCGAHVFEYGADIARIFSIGAPSAEAQRAHDTLRTANEALVSRLQPGVRASELFEDAMKSIRSGGLPDYRRGHVGHSVGLTRAVEEPPILGPQCRDLLQVGMVLSIETPYYTTDIGAINIEDMVVITEGGCEVLNELPRELIAR